MRLPRMDRGNTFWPTALKHGDGLVTVRRVITLFYRENAFLDTGPASMRWTFA